MAIIDLQRRIAEVGRIRIGQQVPIGNTGRTRPAKLDTFRLTSPDRNRITAAAALYGGKPRPWKSPAGNQFEVITDTDTLPVLLPPVLAFTQFYELWSRGGVQRRCDGETESITDRPCQCDPDQRECAIHTRLSVFLPEVPGWGVWRLESQGYYAAVELAGAVDLLELAAERGRIIPATLRLEQRAITRDNQTRRFAVPVLDLDIALNQLAATPQRQLSTVVDVDLADLPAGVDVDLVDLEDQPPPDEPPAPKRRTRRKPDPEEEPPPTPPFAAFAANDPRGMTEPELVEQAKRAPRRRRETTPDGPLTPPPAKKPPSIADQVADQLTPAPPPARRKGAVPIPVTAILPRTAAQAATVPARPSATTGPPEPVDPETEGRPASIGSGEPAAPDPRYARIDIVEDDDEETRAPGPGQLALTPPGTFTSHPQPKLINPRQLKKLMALLNAADFKAHDERVGFLSALLERTIETTNELSSDEANTAIDILEHDGPNPPEPPDDDTPR